MLNCELGNSRRMPQSENARVVLHPLAWHIMARASYTPSQKVKWRTTRAFPLSRICLEFPSSQSNMPCKGIASNVDNKRLNTINFRGSKSKVRSQAEENQVAAVKSMRAQSKVFGVGRVRCVFLRSNMTTTQALIATQYKSSTRPGATSVESAHREAHSDLPNEADRSMPEAYVRPTSWLQ